MRIEDIDGTRCRPEYSVALQEDLRWLGFEWDGPVRRQSEHFNEYQGLLDQLRARGMLYPCFCTRADIAREVAQSAGAPHGPDGALIYPGTCRSLSPLETARRIGQGAPYAMRLNMAAARAAVRPDLHYNEDGVGAIVCHPERFGDIVLGRKETPASYHLCVTHDDALQGVTLVTRGTDLQAATDIHRLLQELMGWPAPAYAHHTMLADEFGRRLAKREGARSLRDLRAGGASPAEIWRSAGLLNST